jgi:hypothetical protein
MIRTRTLAAITTTTCVLACGGCKSSSPAPGSQAAQQQLAAPAAPAAPARPSVPPPPFKVFHRTENSITLVTSDSATDGQIAAIIWQLHDAAANRSFAKLGIPQSFVDARDPILWFHIYRGTKCASEKYTSGTLPCGGGYHAAGDYTLGSFVNKNRDDGALIQADEKETHLWPVT